LASSFIGGQRYLNQMYFDGTTICNYVDFSNLFLTFTCNPQWLEIQSFLSPMNLTTSIRLDVISRVFKIKLDQLLMDLKKNQIFGKVLACKSNLLVWIIFSIIFAFNLYIYKYIVIYNELHFLYTNIYTIEFQERDLPHDHILIFLHPSNKYPSLADIDKSSQLSPNQKEDPKLYECVKNHMMHGPCGSVNRTSPCMKNRTITLFIEEENIEMLLKKNGMSLDNRYVVPYNPQLLVRCKSLLNIK